MTGFFLSLDGDFSSSKGCETPKRRLIFACEGGFALIHAEIM